AARAVRHGRFDLVRLGGPAAVSLRAGAEDSGRGGRISGRSGHPSGVAEGPGADAAAVTLTGTTRCMSPAGRRLALSARAGSVHQRELRMLDAAQHGI